MYAIHTLLFTELHSDYMRPSMHPRVFEGSSTARLGELPDTVVAATAATAVVVAELEPLLVSHCSRHQGLWGASDVSTHGMLGGVAGGSHVVDFSTTPS